MIRIIYLIKKEKRSTFFNATPVPLATACKGSSATVSYTHLTLPTTERV